jgi:hypothetical protein
MAGQEHHSAGEGNGADNYQRMPPMPRQGADPPRAGGGPVTWHLTGARTQYPHAPSLRDQPWRRHCNDQTRDKTENRNITDRTGQGNATESAASAVVPGSLVPPDPAAATLP